MGKSWLEPVLHTKPYTVYILYAQEQTSAPTEPAKATLREKLRRKEQKQQDRLNLRTQKHSAAKI